MTMGLADATCSLTRMNIARNEEVLFVVADPGCLIHGRTTYSLKEAIHRHNSLKNYPFTNPFIYVGIGKYDGYGLIHGLDQETREMYRSISDCVFTIHKFAAEELLQQELNPENLVDQVFSLVVMAFNARINLFGNNLLGEQHCNQHEIDLQRRIDYARSTVINARITQTELLREQHNAPELSEILEGDKSVKIWRFHEAPIEYRKLSDDGGDENWLIYVPANFTPAQYPMLPSFPNIIEGDTSDIASWGNSVDVHTLENGDYVIIFVH